MFSTPEYNHCIPDVLKNTIDWVSRPSFDSPLLSRPCGGILTTPQNPVGGARAQTGLKTILSGTLNPIYPSAEYLLPNTHEMFNESGKLINQVAQRRLVRYVNGFIKWIENNNDEVEK